jgi:hypothetical protein
MALVGENGWVVGNLRRDGEEASGFRLRAPGSGLQRVLVWLRPEA